MPLPIDAPRSAIAKLPSPEPPGPQRRRPQPPWQHHQPRHHRDECARGPVRVVRLFLYGSLAVLLGKLFFPASDASTGFLSSLATFGAGFVVRPFGALLFGRLGDRLGRKPTFLFTILILGSSTVMVGLLPTYGQIGAAAPTLLVAVRLIQGLALGGEYGGAASVVAEHAPPGGAASPPAGSRSPPPWAFCCRW